MKIRGLVIAIIGSVLLIITWGFLPVIMNDEAVTDKWWFIVTWIALFLSPFIIVPWMLFRKGSPIASALKSFSGKTMKNGIPADGTIISIGESSSGSTITINDQPFVHLELEIDKGDGAIYTADIDTVIPRLAVPQFQPGFKVPVIVDPEDPQNVQINFQGALRKPAYGNIEDQAQTDRIAKEGIDVKLKILSIEDTGRSKNFQPIVKMTIQVFPPEKTDYSFEKELPLPTFAIKKIKIGKLIQGRVDPLDPTSISMDIL
ncbi:MAG: hypothetical protein JW737_08115 [Acidobacteria bacterium]|nr:hypothetical protein [Acidobacteriota bacterium]